MDFAIEKAEEYAGFFVEAAAAQGVSGLDYSVASLAVVDRIFDDFHQNGDRPDAMQGTILIGSSYVGEVLRREAGAEWVAGEDVGDEVPVAFRFPMMMRLGTTYLVPFSKVWKRLENGREDSLPFYYNVMLAQAGLGHLPKAPMPVPPVEEKPRPGLMTRLFGRKQ